MNLVFLGSRAIKLSKQFEKYPVFKIYRINDESIGHRRRFLKVPKCQDLATYETMVPNDKMVSFFKSVKDETVLFVSGSETVSLLSLVFLEHLSKLSEVSVVYIRPDILFLNSEKRETEDLVFKTLQYYTMNGLIKYTYLIDSVKAEELLDRSVEIKNYDDSVNEVVSWLFYSVNYYDKQIPSFDNYTNKNLRHAIRTIGAFKVDTSSLEDVTEERRLYDLSEVKEKKYYYILDEEIFKKDISFMGNLRKKIEEKVSPVQKTYYGVYSSCGEKEKGLVLVVEDSVTIQG